MNLLMNISHNEHPPFYFNVHYWNYFYRRPNRSLASICIGACRLVRIDVDCTLVWCVSCLHSGTLSGGVCLGRLVGWRAASSQESLAYLAAKWPSGKVDYQIFIHKISHNVWPDLQYLVTHVKIKSVSLSWLRKIFWENLFLNKLYLQTLCRSMWPWRHWPCAPLI